MKLDSSNAIPIVFPFLRLLHQTYGIDLAASCAYILVTFHRSLAASLMTAAASVVVESRRMHFSFRKSQNVLPPPRLAKVRKASTDWQVYRTRFLVKARQLTEPLVFTDALGREHRGEKGDYLVESSDGSQRIAPKDIFEDIYVAMGPADSENWPAAASRKSLPELSRRRPVLGRAFLA
jgi:hypothetical protein